MFVNRNKLRGMISEKGVKVKDLINQLGISRTAFYNKMNKKTEFTEKEISELNSVFGATIFLDSGVFKMATNEGGNTNE